MRKQLLFLLVYTLPILMISSISANETFNMDDINSSLQLEYQSQLVLQPKRKAQVRKKPVVKRQKRVARQTAPQVQRRTATPPVRHQAPSVRKPSAKAPVPHADELFGAATYGNVNVITRLLQQGVNVNAANSERETALHMAAANGRYSAVIYLINHGANIRSRTINNWLPIHHATRFRKANIANYLMQKGSSPHARTSDGLSAIDMARTMGNQQLLGLFGAR
ncbi:MAG: ankyrin repeat domain-containing protein [Cocleimonas sp.]|nr:ankyrin repeat domain-containing protein [Cocleimonas sp.]